MPLMARRLRKSRGAAFPLQAGAADRALLDRAAEVAGKSLAEFVLDAARQEAEVLLGQRPALNLDATASRTFMSELDSLPRENVGLQNLMQRKVPWQT